MPASPENRTTWPSPSLARSQRSRSSAISCSRPMNGVSAPACAASKRLSVARSPTTRQTRTAFMRPLNSCAPRSSHWYSPPSNRRVVSAITTEPGVAASCSRAARLGVSPETAPASSTPSPNKSPTTTAPVAMPTRASRTRSACGVSAAMASTTSSPARTARSASSSCALGQPK